jgi:membrane associated rhomboid family serine protease
MDRRLVEEWALVLAAADLPNQVERVPGPWRLLCPQEVVTQAQRALEAYDRERSDEARERAAGALDGQPGYGATYLGTSVAALLLGFHSWVHHASGGAAAWIRRGRSASDTLLDGQWWRTLTALTLHADLAHVVGNVAVGLLVFNGVAHWVGPGAAAWAIVLCGALGNGSAALYHHLVPPDTGVAYSSIGASTATFGAVGLLVGLQMGAPRPLLRMARRPRWLALGAGLAIFATLGVGPDADIAAHLCGLAVGTLMGAAMGLRWRRPPRRTVLQPLAACGALLVVAAAWRIAWTASTAPADPMGQDCAASITVPDSQLGSLTNHGGPVATVALPSTRAATRLASANCLPVDARGVLRF